MFSGQSDYTRDGAITRNDMLDVFKRVEKAGTTISAADMHDLNTLLSNASALNMPGYVQVLSGDVINDSSPADVHYQALALGKLAVGGQTAVLTDLVNKWFLGLDLPSIQGAYVDGSFAPATVYSRASAYSSDPLFSSSGPSYKDLEQGKLGDCYFVSALGTIADASPQAIKNMFIDNGDGTYTVRFFTAKGAADYVTVNTALPQFLSVSTTSHPTPVPKDGTTPSSRPNITTWLAYEDLGVDNSLWLPLAEKAYAEWDETGAEGRGGVNAYRDIANGKSGDVYSQVLNAYSTIQWALWNVDPQGVVAGQKPPPQPTQGTGSETLFLAGLANPTDAVTIGTLNSFPGGADYDSATGLYAGHCYVVLGYHAAQDPSKDTFQLYNPWGCDQPKQDLTWSQLQTDCKYYAYVNAAPVAVRFPRPFGQVFNSNLERILCFPPRRRRPATRPPARPCATPH